MEYALRYEHPSTGELVATTVGPATANGLFRQLAAQGVTHVSLFDPDKQEWDYLKLSERRH